MLGTIVNTCTILIGGMVGSILGTGIKEKYKKVLFDALGLCCLVLGINAALPNMAKSEYPVMFIAKAPLHETKISQQSEQNRPKLLFHHH